MGTGLISAAGPPRTLKSEGVWPGGGRTPRVCPQWVALGGGGGAKLPVRAALWMDVRGDFPPRSESNGLCPPPVHPWGVWGNFCRLWLLGKGAETQIMGAGGGGGSNTWSKSLPPPTPPPPPKQRGFVPELPQSQDSSAGFCFPPSNPSEQCWGGEWRGGGTAHFSIFLLPRLTLVTNSLGNHLSVQHRGKQPPQLPKPLLNGLG